MNHALAAIERHLGFPISRGRTVASRLQEAGYIERGAPGVAPRISFDGFIALFIGLASDKTLSEVGVAVAKYLDATPRGVSLDGAPTSVVRLGVEILTLAETALEYPSDLAAVSIEVVASWPEVVIRHLEGKTRFVPVGANAYHWQAAGHRTSTTINGAAFRDCVRAIFKGR
ncbi:hypothetical protein [Devosia sediminis]|uniref:Uncharacterized protein n=1 Tax=Devosia sediminis TaxID=2798801 RepID=A0A934IXQ3_9HYPH|nr:hypothetical protein [Devosia sediminis]MBJ3783854.1 hypothetical protein [Devosia sediminis]